MLKIIFTLSIIISAFSPGNKSINQINTEWKTLSKDNYSIQYPETWQLSENGEMNTKFILAAPADTNNPDFHANINMMIQDLKGAKMTLKSYAELSEKQIHSMLKEPVIIESKTITDKPIPYHKIIYSGKYGTMDCKWEQHAYLYKGKVYLVTLTCKRTNFDMYKDDGEKILDSFEIKK